MSESPIVTKSAFPYQIVIFVLIQVLSLPIWKLKDRVRLDASHWNFLVREVKLKEYKSMIKEYNRKYRQFVSKINYYSIIIAIVFCLMILFIPFPLLRTNSVIIGLSPIIIALLVVGFSLFAGIAIFEAIPNSVTDELPVHNPHKFNKIIQFLSSLPGISWCGIRMDLGEDRGYYTIRNPIPVARIEGIESIAWLECKTNSNDLLTSISSCLEKGESKEPEVIGELKVPTPALPVVELIRKTILSYIDRSENNEFLEEVLEEIDTFITNTKRVSTRNE